jgi:hypothetical protein
VAGSRAWLRPAPSAERVFLQDLTFFKSFLLQFLLIRAEISRAGNNPTRCL